MRTLLCLLAIAAAVSTACGLEIVYSEHRDADSLKRISEYFTGKENPGRYTIVRTHSDRRDGHYVALKLQKEDEPERFQEARISFIESGSQEAQTVTVPVEMRNKNRLLIGITGPEWAPSNAVPVAWKIEFLDSAGQVVASEQSFLWSPRD